MTNDQSTNWKYPLIIIILSFFVMGGVIIYREIPERAEEIPVHKCDFSRPADLRKTTRYGIFGDDEFDTIVCGYLVERKKHAEDKYPTAYFAIVDFYDAGLRESIEKELARGNTINSKRNEIYELSLGCFGGENIIGVEYDKAEPYIDSITTAKIMDSSSENPISIILSFGKHEGHECTCCNLPHKIRIYE